MPISKIKLPDNSTQEIRDLRVPGSILFPDLSELEPVETHTFSTSKAAYFTIMSRSNGASEDMSFANEVILYRITGTGSSPVQKQVLDCVTIFFGKRYCETYVLNRGGLGQTNDTTTSAAYYMRWCNPKAENSGHPVLIDIYTYNATARTFVVDVFKTSPAVTWYDTATVSVYNTTNYSTTTAKYTSPYNYPGLITLHNVRVNITGSAGSATSSSYISAYLPMFPGYSSVLTAGAAVVASMLVFMTDDGYVWPISDTTHPISTSYGISRMGTGYAANAKVASYAYIVNLGAATLNATTNPGVTLPTMTVGKTIYLRCSLANGAIYSDAVLTDTVTPGHTWVTVGTIVSATVIECNAMGREYFTLDANGALTHINGKEIAGGVNSLTTTEIDTIIANEDA